MKSLSSRTIRVESTQENNPAQESAPRITQFFRSKINRPDEQINYKKGGCEEWGLGN